MEGKTLAERVAELARIQEEAGYMASWEITEGGYILRERNCPIYHVACRFQHACRFELELFRRLLGADITRFRHQVNGEESCAYLIREKESPGAVRRRTGGKIPRRSHPSRIADQSIEHDPRA
jgi:predicted ArsR family transcriptional regulator